jgi:hypothetical protein
MSRPDDLATFGRQMAAAQGVLDDRSQRDWFAYGQACHDALAQRRPMPPLRPARRRPWLPNVVWGLMWRYGVLGALVIAAQLQPQKPWSVIAGVLVGGVLLGLWRRRWALARLWRTVVVAGGAVYIAPLFSVYPDALAGSIGALTLAPLLATWRRR